MSALLQEDPRLVAVEASPTCDKKCHEDVKEALVYRWSLRQLREPQEPVDAVVAVEKSAEVRPAQRAKALPTEVEEEVVEMQPKQRVRALPAAESADEVEIAPVDWSGWAGLISAGAVAVWTLAKIVSSCSTACGVLRFLHAAPPTQPEDEEAPEADEGGEEDSPRRSVRLQNLEAPTFRPRLSSTRRPVAALQHSIQAGNQTLVFCPPVQGYVDAMDVTASLSTPVAAAVHLLRWLPGVLALIQRGPVDVAGFARVRVALGLQIEVPMTGGILASV